MKLIRENDNGCFLFFISNGERIRPRCPTYSFNVTLLNIKDRFLEF